MTNDLPRIEEALEELASMGRRITELTDTFLAHGGSSPEERQPVEEGADASASDAGDRTEESLSPLTTTVTTPAPLPAPRRHAAAGKPMPPQSPSDRPPPPARQRRPVGPLLVSTGLHVLVLLGLAMVVFTQKRPPEPISILSTPLWEEPLDEFVEVDVTAFDTEAFPESEQADVSGPELPDVAVLDPTPMVAEPMASVADSLPFDSGDLFGGGIDVGDLLASVEADA